MLNRFRSPLPLGSLVTCSFGRVVTTCSDVSLLKRLLRLRFACQRVASSDSVLKFSGPDTYVYNKYSPQRAQRTLGLIEERVDAIIDADRVALLDHCNILSRFKPNHKLIRLIQDHIDYYNNPQGLYHVLLYLLKYNTLAPKGSNQIRDFTALVSTILDKICDSFDEVRNKLGILALLNDFDMLHDDFSCLIYSHLVDTHNAPILRGNLGPVLTYLDNYNKRSCNKLDLDILASNYIEVVGICKAPTHDLLTLFKFLLCQGHDNLDHVHLKEIVANLRLNRLSHVVMFFEAIEVHPLPGTYYLSMVDDAKILSMLVNRIELIDIHSLIRISTPYSLFFSHNRDPAFTRFINLALSRILSHIESLKTASMFSQDRPGTLPPGTDLELPAEDVLKLMRKVNKLLYSIDLTALDYRVLVAAKAFLEEYDRRLRYLLSQYHTLGDKYDLLGARSLRLFPRGQDVLYFDDVNPQNFLLVEKPGSTTASPEGSSRLHAEVRNVLGGMGISTSNEIALGPYRVDILLA